MVELETLNRVMSELEKAFWDAFVEGKGLVTKWKNVSDIIARVELAYECRYRFKLPRYYHTGIEPKCQNRTRRKQRLTRLQRRWKRQKR